MSIQSRLAQLEQRAHEVTSEFDGFDIARLTDDERADFTRYYARAKVTDLQGAGIRLLPIDSDAPASPVPFSMAGFDVNRLEPDEAERFLLLCKRAATAPLIVLWPIRLDGEKEPA